MAFKGTFEPAKMPPTERSAYFHGLRVHHQIMTWKMLDNNNNECNPEEWGWYAKDDELLPIKRMLRQKTCLKS